MPLSAAPRLVVKVGSSLLVERDGALRRDWLATLVADIAAAQARGQRIVVVSSGAIALGARRLGLAKGGRASLEDAQAAAATGQILLARAWSELLAAHGLTAAQMLLTLDDLEDRRRYLNAAATLDRLLTLGVVPVVNENDSVATAEIRFGDNDRLAARVGVAARAGGVLLLSDVDGLHSANPATDPGAELIECVTRIDDAVLAMAKGPARAGLGSGGMTSKLQAARIATAAGLTLAIARGTHDHPLARFLETGRGTLFTPGKSATARKAWLGGRLRVAGAIHVDAGAATAVRGGASLLAAGAVRIEGRFARGDAVDIVGPQGTVARGLSEYASDEAAAIAGARNDRQAALLGYAPRSALVHRDHLALL